MANYRSGLLTPPREEEERKIYRPVWRSLIIENAAMAGVMVVLFFLQWIIGISFPARLQTPINILIASMPVILWFMFSALQENAYPQPRHRLVPTAILAALLARAIGEPFISEVLQISEWLPLTSAINRIIGYTFTVGIVECGLCYLAVRALTWPDYINDRYDTIAYGTAAAIGYTFVRNLEFALAGQPLGFVVALNTFGNVTVLIVSMFFIAYGMAAVRFDNAGVFAQPAAMAIAALITGIALPLRGGFLNASFSSDGIVFPRYLYGIGFSIGLFVALVLVINFLFRFAERQAKERESSEAF